MSSATAIVSAPASFGRTLAGESRMRNSRTARARLLCSGVSASVKRPLASNLKFADQSVRSVCIPVLGNALQDSSWCRKTKYHSPCVVNATARQPDLPGKLDVDRLISALRNLWDKFPPPVKRFPWTKALISFCELIFELTSAVAKYLCVPLLAVSSLSEMSYCAHERKMIYIPIPFLIGFAVAGALKETAIELSPDLKEGGFPGHILLIAIFFLLLKLPGPYYPYLGRLIIPHFANGGLWRSAWSVFIWYRMHGRPSGTASGVSVADSPLGDEK